MLEPQYEVVSEDEILRRVKLPPPGKTENDLMKILPDGTKQIARIAFRPHPERDKDGLSVNIIGLAKSVDELYDSSTHLGVKLAVAKCYEYGLTVTHNPLVDDTSLPDYSHALVKELMNRKDLQALLAECCTCIE